MTFTSGSGRTEQSDDLAAKMYSGNYRYKDIKICNSSVGREVLLSEGISSDKRNWAFLKQWNERPYYRDEFGEKYVIRIDFSEWFPIYRKYCSDIYSKKLIDFSFLKKFSFLKTGGFINRSPGWWDNGFGSQMCFAVTVAKYLSPEVRFNQVIKYGWDIDSLDKAELVEELCSMLDPAINFFKSVGMPAMPETEWEF